jgi:hypothetical protein
VRPAVVGGTPRVGAVARRANEQPFLAASHNPIM